MGYINEPLEVVTQKTLPRGQVTKIRIAGAVAYVRENVVQLTQVLELCAPEHLWAEIASVIALEDHLKRPVQQNKDFTSEWAEAALTS